MPSLFGMIADYINISILSLYLIIFLIVMIITYKQVLLKIKIGLFLILFYGKGLKVVVNEMIKTVLLVDVLIWYQHKCKAGGGVAYIKYKNMVKSKLYLCMVQIVWTVKNIAR